MIGKEKEHEVIYLYDHSMAKQLNEERVRRSLAKRQRTVPLIDGFVRPQPETDADIVEVEFGTWCQSQAMGA